MTTPERKSRVVLVSVGYVSSDGFPVDEDGEECAISGKPQATGKEEMRKSQKWLDANPTLWTEVSQ